MINFDQLGLAKSVARGVKSAGYEKPTPIQATAIPIALEGRDLIGCAQTGTGKTAAFVLPLLNKLVLNKPETRRPSLRALIVVPTRELALQVEEAIGTYSRHTSIRSLAVFGGTGMYQQTKILRKGVDIVVATPGRLLDHMERRNVRLANVEMLILDEADRMLDMGFIPDIRKVVAATPNTRQTMFFSATMPKAVKELASSILKNPEYIEMGQRTNPAKTVNQRVCAVLQENKMELLAHILDTEPVENVIIFSRTKHRADRIARKLSRKGFATAVLHSNRTQPQREHALKGFKSGKYQIMVATNIAARGIDVDSISHVINYDTPEQPEEYIHRIGRTGRAETKGDAITFVGEGEISYQKDIERHIGSKLEYMDCDGLTEMKGHPITIPSSGGGNRGKKRFSGKSNGGRQFRGRNGKPGGAKKRRSNNTSSKFA
ncbi:MAG: DEAD/DEAH box helicase [Rhodothermales bacterium]